MKTSRYAAWLVLLAVGVLATGLSACGPVVVHWTPTPSATVTATEQSALSIAAGIIEKVLAPGTDAAPQPTATALPQIAAAAPATATALPPATATKAQPSAIQPSSATPT
ncbi:MAG: hypothetical protein GXY76_00095, partial [Chloroflexi bacterium]|nr:hypothetical protein [Chloroflexota bacterium]